MSISNNATMLGAAFTMETTYGRAVLPTANEDDNSDNDWLPAMELGCLFPGNRSIIINI